MNCVTRSLSSPAFWVSLANGKHQQDIRGKEEELGYFFSPDTEWGSGEDCVLLCLLRCISNSMGASVSISTNWVALNNINLFSYSYIGGKPTIKVSTGLSSLQRLERRILPGFFQLPVAPDIPWLVVTSFQSLPPSSQDPLSPFLF